MPKKKKKSALSQAEQSERFVATVRELEAAGQLNRTVADRRFNELMGALRDSSKGKPSAKA